MNKTDGFLPLPTLLSHALVAFTIEFDNEFEHRMPHRTTDKRLSDAAAGPWLVSLAMWDNCMRFLGNEGLRQRELEDLALAKTNLDGMRRWGYIEIVGDPAGTRARPAGATGAMGATGATGATNAMGATRPAGSAGATGSAGSDPLLRPTRAGRAAREVWRPLAGEIERRWCARFGRGTVDQLRQSLVGLVGQSRRPLPYYLPILGYGLWTGSRVLVRRPGSGSGSGSGAGVGIGAGASVGAAVSAGNPADLELPTLLSRALLGFALAYERESLVSLAVGSNLLRVLDQDGVRVRDLPQLTGVAKPGIEMALGILQKLDFAGIGPDPDGSRWKIARLTSAGAYAKAAHDERLRVVEQGVQARFGADAVTTLRRTLGPLVGDPTGQRSPLYGGLAPYPDGWRAKVREPDTLPHFPMVLHRGGYPDGS